MQLVADAEVVTPGRFHALIIVEDTWTGDGRMFTEGSLTWRDLPFPLMAIDRTTWAHEDAIMVGNFDTIERRGTELHGWGSYIQAEPDSEAERLIGMIQRGELRGVSADIDDVEFQVLFPVEPPVEGESVEEAADVFDDPAEEQEAENIDGQDYVVLEMPEPRMRVTLGRIMGATAVPFPAFQEAFVEPDTEGSTEPAELAASAAPILAAHRVTGAIVGADAPPEPETVTIQGQQYTTTPPSHTHTLSHTHSISAAGTGAHPHPAPAATITPPTTAGTTVRENPASHFSFPAIPPREWFQVPETPGPMPLTINDDGQVFGHIALWGECHVGFDGVCVEPPASECSYARFHVGEIAVDDGGRISVGRITFGTGHADRGLDARATQAHYDNTGSIGAYVVAMDGEHGIWCCGAMRSGLTDAQVQEFMAAPPSGDWRRFGDHLEMVGVLNVNVPGFNTPRGELVAAAALVRRDEGLVSSLIVQHPAPEKPAWLSADEARRAALHRKAIERIAASIGRGQKHRIAAAVARVHGGK